MPRGPIYQDKYKPQFSGHETFPLRYGWLKKAYDAVDARRGDPDSKAAFTRDDAIAHFGVGKNMVASMRHWAAVCGIIADGETSGQVITPLCQRSCPPLYFSSISQVGWIGQ